MRLDEIGGDWWRLDEGDERIQAYTVGTGKGTGRPREERGVPCGSYVQIVDASRADGRRQRAPSHVCRSQHPVYRIGSGTGRGTGGTLYGR